MNADMNRDFIGRPFARRLSAFICVHLWFHFPLGSHRPLQALGERR